MAIDKLRHTAFNAKLKAANAALHTFAEDTEIQWIPGKGFYIKWIRDGQTTSRPYRLQSEGSHYFMGYGLWPHGGTAALALFQLIRWLKDLPCVSIFRWHYWAGEQVKLCDPKTIEILREAGYPKVAHCVFCGEHIASSADWFTVPGKPKKSGLGHWNKSCQKGGSDATPT